ncbi:hypothetical protein AFLA_005572 [Aspergillus flavus NRRL3357]|nr:hypothetical protein AFLA_005572 [Aspergillus flavus NRRL3357]
MHGEICVEHAWRFSVLCVPSTCRHILHRYSPRPLLNHSELLASAIADELAGLRVVNDRSLASEPERERELLRRFWNSIRCTIERTIGPAWQYLATLKSLVDYMYSCALKVKLALGLLVIAATKKPHGQEKCKENDSEYAIEHYQTLTTTYPEQRRPHLSPKSTKLFIDNPPAHQSH